MSECKSMMIVVEVCAEFHGSCSHREQVCVYVVGMLFVTCKCSFSGMEFHTRD